ncbi:hypothetical protein AB0J80_06280 [Actinoplanes sp. NPDC049548]|uniref:hypothetical protein n=1 Tax=Actinoplanes sp. NPDC049548 TaxID=3155152 RepID=UPI003431EDF7
MASLEAIAERGTGTVREVAAAVGVSVVTANNVVRDLEAAGAIDEIARRQGHRGPRARVFRVSPARTCFVAVRVDPGRMTARCGDATGTGPAVTVAGTTPETLADLVDRAAREQRRDAGQVRGVVAGVSPGFTEAMGARAADLLGTPVRVHRGDHLAALAEAEVGAGRGAAVFLRVTGGPAPSTTLVLDGAPREGAHGAAGAMDRIPPQLTGTRAADGTELTAYAVALACVIADPELVVLDQGVAEPELLPDRIRSVVKELAGPEPEVVPSAVPGDPVLTGGRRLAWSGILADLARRAMAP